MSRLEARYTPNGCEQFYSPNRTQRLTLFNPEKFPYRAIMYEIETSRDAWLTPFSISESRIRSKILSYRLHIKVFGWLGETNLDVLNSLQIVADGSWRNLYSIDLSLWGKCDDLIKRGIYVYSQIPQKINIGETVRRFKNQVKNLDFRQPELVPLLPGIEAPNNFALE